MTKNPKIRKVLLSCLFIVLNVVVITVAGVSEFGNSENAAELSEVRLNGWLLIPAALCFLIAITAEISKYVTMMRWMGGKNAKPRKELQKVARRTVLLGRYYDNITPAAVGGQPFQMYYMRKHSGLSKGASTSIPIIGMISLQITFILIALICFLFGGVANDHPVLLATAWFGLLFYAFWPVMAMGISFFPKPTAKFIKWVVKVLSKVHFIKNRELALVKVEEEIKEYVRAVKAIMKAKGMFTYVIILSLVFNFLMATIPFFVLTAFGGDVNFWTCFGTTVAVMSAVYFIPTPGNSGAAEGTFYAVFSSLSTGYVFWAMLVWRLFSYYIYIIIGLIIYSIMHFERKNGG